MNTIVWQRELPSPINILVKEIGEEQQIKYSKESSDADDHTLSIIEPNAGNTSR